jgi:hypothetical protein
LYVTALNRERSNVRSKAAALSIAICAVVLSDRTASAEVSVVKSDGWELYTTGRVGIFFADAYGDSNPVPPMGVTESFTDGGLVVAKDGMTSPLGVQAKLHNMRLRSGFVPNVFALGLRRQVTDHTVLTAHMALWATVDTEGQRKTENLFAWVQEWYLKLEGPWGSVVAGRALDLFSRGATQNDFMYLHGYGLGFPGNVESNPNGPAPGLIGFGVMAAFFSSGVAYASPTWHGIQNTVGAYDATPLPGGYEATRYPRFEDELTYDLTRPNFKLHLFANGEFQSVYRSGSDLHANSYGVGYGGRAEFGNFHLGLAGHWGKGLGLFFALEPDNVSVSSATFELRTFDGYSAVAQYVAGPFDINGGFGISRVFLLASDAYRPGTLDPSPLSVLKYQMAFAAALVYHVRSYLHLSLDFMRMQAQWFGAPAVLAMGYPAEHQNVNFTNLGVTVTW